jgi:hypothetical protein
MEIETGNGELMFEIKTAAHVMCLNIFSQNFVGTPGFHIIACYRYYMYRWQYCL